MVHLKGQVTLAQARAPPPKPEDATRLPNDSLLETEVVVALEGGADLANELARDKPAVMRGALESNYSVFTRTQLLGDRKKFFLYFFFVPPPSRRIARKFSLKS